jgi:hypothetical protein
MTVFDDGFCPEAYYDGWDHLPDGCCCVRCGVAIAHESPPAGLLQKSRSDLAIEVQEQVERILGRYVLLDGFDTAVAQVSRLVVEYAEGRRQ